MLTHFILLPGLYFVYAEVDRLRVHAEPAVAELAMQQAGRNLVNLPQLEFRLSITPHCAAGGQPESLSITIADTHTNVRGEDLQSTTSIDVSMLVSASQLAPFALREFCVDPASVGESLLLTAALAAQVSLRCARAEGQSVRVDCIASAAEAERMPD